MSNLIHLKEQSHVKSFRCPVQVLHLLWRESADFCVRVQVY